MTKLHYKIITDAADDETVRAWRDCLDHSELASHYTSPAFFVEPYFMTQNPFAVLVFDRNQVVGVTCGLVDGRSIACGVPSRPQVCFRRDADIASVSAVMADGLLAVGHADLVSVYCLRPAPGFVGRRFTERTYRSPVATRMLRVERDPEILFKGFSATLRSDVRRSIKAGVEVSEMNLDNDFPDYFRIYEEWCRQHQITPKTFEMQRAAFALTANRLILVAKHEGRIIGVSTYRHCAPGIVEYSANVSGKDDRKRHQNALLTWRAIEWACRGNFSWFSMGGDHFFLSRFGGEVFSTVRYRRDQTFFRRYDATEWLRGTATSLFGRMPSPLRSRVRVMLGRRAAE